MQLTATPAILLAGILPAVPFVSRKPNLPVLGHACLEATPDGVRLTATNLDAGYQGTLADVQVDEPGAVLVPLHRLADLLQHLPKDGTVTLRSTASQVRLTASHGHWTMPLMPTDDFPAVPHAQADDPQITLPASALVRLLSSTLYAAEESSPRAIHQVVHLEGEAGVLHIVCTNGYTLAWSQHRGEEVPDLTCHLLASAGMLGQRWAARLETKEVTLTLGASVAFWTCGDVTISTRLVDVSYPDWRALLSREKHASATLPLAALLDILARCATQQDATPGDPVQLILDTDLLIVEAFDASANAALSREELPCLYAGPPTHYRIKNAMLRDILTHLPDSPEQVTLACQTPTTPLRLTPHGDDTHTVVAMGLSGSRPATASHEDALASV